MVSEILREIATVASRLVIRPYRTAHIRLRADPRNPITHGLGHHQLLGCRIPLDRSGEIAQIVQRKAQRLSEALQVNPRESDVLMETFSDSVLRQMHKIFLLGVLLDFRRSNEVSLQSLR